MSRGSLLVCGALALFVGAARADVIFETPLIVNSNTNMVDVGSGDFISSVSTDVTLTNIAIYGRFDDPNRIGGVTYPNTIKFLIFDHPSHTLLYESAAKTFASSASPDWLESDPFSYVLEAGHQYDIGAVAERMRWYVRTILGGVEYSYTENGITAIRTSDGTGNPDIRDFDDPYALGHGSLFLPLRLSGSVSSAGSVPEPGAILLLATALAATVVLRRRR